jgi:hypothetical protein
LGSDPEDEIKAIVALGIVAGILVYLQIIGTGHGILPGSGIQPTFWGGIIGLFIYLELVVFGLYVVLLTLSLGIKPFKLDEVWADTSKSYADVFFGIGAVLLFPFAVVSWFYLAIKGGSASGADRIFDFALGVAIVAVLLLAVIYRERHKDT